MKKTTELMKEKNGITLISLVITIIVLLILAGISITMLTGNNSILNQATNAKEQTKIKNEEERLKIAVMSVLTDGLGKITTENLNKAVGSEFGKDKSVTETADGWTYTGEQNTYTISSSGVITVVKGDEPSGNTITWTIASDADGSTDVSVGDEITASTGETFYVIKKDSNIITLLSKHCLATDKNESGDYYQFDLADGLPSGYYYEWTRFASNVYWTTTDINSASGYSEGDAMEMAVAYGRQHGGRGRLLTYNEAETLPQNEEATLANRLSDIIIGTDSTGGYFFYWLGNASSSNLEKIYCYSGMTNDIQELEYDSTNR